MTERKIAVLVVDGHLVVRNSLRLMLASSRDIAVTGVARTAVQARAMVLAQEFDVALMDIDLPDHNGLKLLKRLRLDRPAMAVLMFSMYADEIYAAHALKFGAVGYLTKSSSAEALVAAVREAASGARLGDLASVLPG